jgi:hypothetical protein
LKTENHILFLPDISQSLLGLKNTTRFRGQTTTTNNYAGGHINMEKLVQLIKILSVPLK